MSSSTKNVKIGPCRVYLGGIDLGLTKGGVEVDIKTDTYKSEVDQFGKTPITELIMARTVTAKVPMAETTVQNLAMVFPGATITSVGGASASGTFTVASQPADGDAITVNGQTVTFKTSVTGPFQVQIGAAAASSAANLAAYLAASTNKAIALANYTVATDVVTATYYTEGVEGNGFTLASGEASVTVSGAKMTGGTDPTSISVTSTDGVGTNLLTVAQELRFHPMDHADNDYSDDFVIFNAATAGSAKFSYQLEQERVFDCEFTGYPDSTTRRLFGVGIST
jgi:hypothetical protein